MLDRKECEHLIGAVDAELADPTSDVTLPIEWCAGWDAAVREHAEPLVKQLRAALAEIDRLNAALPNWSHAEALQQRDAMIAANVEAHGRIRQLTSEVEALTERQQKHLQMIATLSQSAPLADELAGWGGQRAKLIAEVGSLRAQVADLERKLAEPRALADEHATVSAIADWLERGPSRVILDDTELALMLAGAIRKGEWRR